MNADSLATIFIFGGFGAVIFGLAISPLPLWSKICIFGAISFIVGGGIAEE